MAERSRLTPAQLAALDYLIAKKQEDPSFLGPSAGTITAIVNVAARVVEVIAEANGVEGRAQEVTAELTREVTLDQLLALRQRAMGQ